MHVTCEDMKTTQSEALATISNGWNKSLHRWHLSTYVNKNMKLHKNPQSTDKARTLSLILYILHIIIYKWNPNQSESNDDFSAYIYR